MHHGQNNQPKEISNNKWRNYKYHASGKTIWSKGKVKKGEPQGYWEWYRIDGTLKRSGYLIKERRLEIEQPIMTRENLTK